MKIGWKFAFVILGTIFTVGLVLYLAQRPPGKAVVLRVPPTSLPIQVHVSGGVVVEGVYTLPPGSRVMDAIEAAGGLALEAKTEGINLAAFLEDGEKIYIPYTAIEEESADVSEPVSKDGSASVEPEDLININTASQDVLETLPRIGPELAQEIIAYRELNGYFETTEELINVKGIGQVTYDQLRELITVEELP